MISESFEFIEHCLDYPISETIYIGVNTVRFWRTAFLPPRKQASRIPCFWKVNIEITSPGTLKLSLPIRFFFQLCIWNSAPSKMLPYCFHKIMRHWETNLGNIATSLFTSWAIMFNEATFREKLFPSLAVDRKTYLSKCSFIKRTCLWRDKFILPWIMNRQAKKF